MKILLTISVIYILLLVLDSGIELNLIGANIKIKIILFSVIKIGVFEKNIKEKSIKSKKEGTLEIRQIINYIKVSHYLTDEIKKFLSKARIKLNLNMSFGLDEADKTAMIFGVLNLFIYSIDGLLRNYINEFESRYDITPVFNRTHIDLKFDLIIRIKNYHLLYYIFKFIFILIKYYGKGELAYGTSN